MSRENRHNVMTRRVTLLLLDLAFPLAGDGSRCAIE